MGTTKSAHGFITELIAFPSKLNESTVKPPIIPTGMIETFLIELKIDFTFLNEEMTILPIFHNKVE